VVRERRGGKLKREREGHNEGESGGGGKRRGRSGRGRKARKIGRERVGGKRWGRKSEEGTGVEGRDNLGGEE